MAVFIAKINSQMCVVCVGTIVVNSLNEMSIWQYDYFYDRSEFECVYDVIVICDVTVRKGWNLWQDHLQFWSVNAATHRTSGCKQTE